MLKNLPSEMMDMPSEDGTSDLVILNRDRILPGDGDWDVENKKMAMAILNVLMQFRRTVDIQSKCDMNCQYCHLPHVEKVIAAVSSNQPLTLVLPAFPGKSPNLSKVLSPLPDKAEELALQFLEDLCNRIENIYSPGARIILCSDGRVFSDIVGMREIDVTDYQSELKQMIARLQLLNISTFNLDEVFPGSNYVQMRHQLMENHGVPMEHLRNKIVRGSKSQGSLEDEESHRMYCGITRFLVEDQTFPGQIKSRSAIQRESKARAFEVIRRSNAWSELIAKHFPEAVRLSIHPQTCGSKKLGIQLIGTESWMTPWHGVAVKTSDGFMLLKRSEAESLGAHLVLTSEGQPTHFELPERIYRSLKTNNRRLQHELLHDKN